MITSKEGIFHVEIISKEKTYNLCDEKLKKKQILISLSLINTYQLSLTEHFSNLCQDISKS